MSDGGFIRIVGIKVFGGACGVLVVACGVPMDANLNTREKNSHFARKSVFSARTSVDQYRSYANGCKLQVSHKFYELLFTVVHCNLQSYCKTQVDLSERAVLKYNRNIFIKAIMIGLIKFDLLMKSDGIYASTFVLILKLV